MIDDLSFLQSVGPLGPGTPNVAPGPKAQPSTPFSDIFEQKLQPDLKLSAHAQQRLSSRQIQLTPQDWDKIHRAVDKAAAKGAKESLVLTDKAALVVSVKNRTVITAVDPASMKENVFTNIDSAVIC
ncbi:MAG TPA: TIGR02530 family flagellar biosynthesis protein [Oscillatoriaceae cyanobacterium]